MCLYSLMKKVRVLIGKLQLKNWQKKAGKYLKMISLNQLLKRTKKFLQEIKVILAKYLEETEAIFLVVNDPLVNEL